MLTQLGAYCQQFDGVVRPLLHDIASALAAIDAAPQQAPGRALQNPLRELRHQLTALSDKVLEQQAYVLIFGPLKSGKSTLMNAIAGTWVSEVSSLPAYPCLVFVSAGQQREYVVTAYDAHNGKVLWTYDPKVATEWARLACCGPSARGIAAWKGNIYIGALDGRLIAVDAMPWKFDLARKLGATDCVDATAGDPVAAVQALTGGGADFVFECIGLVKTVQQAVAMTGRGGTAVLVGLVPMQQLVPLSAFDITLQEKKVTGSYMGSNRFRFDMPKYVDFYLDGRLRLDEMISARIGLDEVNEAFDRMRKGEAARQVIVFD